MYTVDQLKQGKHLTSHNQSWEEPHKSAGNSTVTSLYLYVQIVLS